MALQGAIFNLKAQMAFKIQDLAYQTEELILNTLNDMQIQTITPPYPMRIH